MGRFQDALAAVQKGMEVAGRQSLLLQVAGCAYGLLGMRSEAGEILAELRQRASGRYLSAIYEAYVLGAMGEMDEAFRMFERAVEQRSSLLAFVHVTHETAIPALKSDPRFAALLKRAHLDIP
jgi:tetratricopeptide (TPR) repeat protein